MKSFESDAFGKVPAAEGVEELFEFVLSDPPSDSLIWMWRGQPDAAWPLHSTAYRRLALRGSVKEQDLQRYEKSLLKRATQRGHRVVDGKELSDLELLARLRHHGAATRLVDATRSWAVGLWFAVSQLPDRPGVLIGLHAYDLLGYEGTLEHRTQYPDLVEYWTTNADTPWTWEPPNVTPRIAAQHSQFLASALSTALTGSLVLPETRDRSRLVVIPADLKMRCREVLISVFDIRDVTLFPDLDGFGLVESFGRDPSASFRW